MKSRSQPRVIPSMDSCVEALGALELSEQPASQEQFLAEANALSGLLGHAASLVRHAVPGTDLSPLFLYVGTGLPDACRKAALQPNAEGGFRSARDILTV